MEHGNSYGGVIEYIKTNKLSRIIGLGGAGILLASCGSSVEATSNSSANDPSAVSSESALPTNEAPKVKYPDTSNNITRFNSIGDVESAISDNVAANDNVLSLQPLLYAASGNLEYLEKANVDSNEIVANYLINQYFLSKTLDLREQLLYETNTTGYSNPDSINFHIEQIEASQFLLAQVIDYLSANNKYLESDNQCPENNTDDKVLLDNGTTYISKTQAPLGTFGFTKESQNCNISQDIKETTQDLMLFLFNFGNEYSLKDGRPVSAELFSIMKSVYSAQDPKVQNIINKYLN